MFAPRVEPWGDPTDARRTARQSNARVSLRGSSRFAGLAGIPDGDGGARKGQISSRSPRLGKKVSPRVSYPNNTGRARRRSSLGSAGTSTDSPMTSVPAPRPPPPPNKGVAWGRWVTLLAVVAVLVFLFLAFDVRAILREVLAAAAGLGVWGPVLFILVYIVAAVLFVPGSVLTLGAGAIFGVVWGSVYVSIAATLGATAAFLVGRYLARDWVARKIEGNETFAAIDRAVADEGWKIVGLTRLSPVFPFTLLNYAFGLTRVKLGHYMLASWIGMMPGTVMYVYLGSLARAGAAVEEKTPAEWALYGVGLVATIAVTVFITRIARRALAQRAHLAP